MGMQSPSVMPCCSPSATRWNAVQGHSLFLVRRWAKDRGICHAAAGHLHPYAWSLLVIYFLQVGVKGECPLLPPLENFALFSNLIMGTSAEEPKSGHVTQTCTEPKMSVGALFHEFVCFYNQEFNWQKEMVSVCLGKRAEPV